MKKIKILFLAIITVISFASCTSNSRAKNFGGTSYYKIPASEKFINITWKGDDYWVLTKKRDKNDTTKSTYIFKEKSNYNIMEGKIVITEQ